MRKSDAPIPETQVYVDPLAFLPCSEVIEYHAGKTIYEAGSPATTLYLSLGGMVKLVYPFRDGNFFTDFCFDGEFFGLEMFSVEQVRTGKGKYEDILPLHSAKAVIPLGVTVRLMSWTYQEVAEIARKRPKLAFALSQVSARKQQEFVSRFQSSLFDKGEVGAVKALARLGKKEWLGNNESRVNPREAVLAHISIQDLADYTGVTGGVIGEAIEKLVGENLILCTPERIVIKDLAALEQYINSMAH